MLKRIILEEIRNVLNEQDRDDINKRAQDAFDAMDKEAERDEQPPAQQRPAPTAPQKQPPQQAQQKPAASAPMTAQEAIKVGPAVYTAIANAAIQYLAEYQRSQPDVRSRSDMMFKLMDANKQLDMARKNPKYFPKDNIAIVALTKMRDLMSSNKADFDAKAKKGQNTTIQTT